MRNKLHFSNEECCHLDLHIIDYCQLQCKHCYLNQGSRTMPMNMIQEICHDFISGSLPTKHRLIILNGGDVLLHPEFAAISHFIRGLTGKVVFSSNGILIKDVIHLLNSSDFVQVSLDGDKETHDIIRGIGNYNVAIKALELLNSHNIPHSISFTVHQQNIHCISHILDIAMNTGSKLLNLNLYTPVISSDLIPLPYNEWIRFKESVRNQLTHSDVSLPRVCSETGCIAGILGISVLPDGTYWDCSRNQEIIGRYPEKISDVLDWNRISDGLCKDPFTTCYRGCKK